MAQPSTHLPRFDTGTKFLTPSTSPYQMSHPQICALLSSQCHLTCKHDYFTLCLKHTHGSHITLRIKFSQSELPPVLHFLLVHPPSSYCLIFLQYKLNQYKFKISLPSFLQLPEALMDPPLLIGQTKHINRESSARKNMGHSEWLEHRVKEQEMSRRDALSWIRKGLSMPK